MEILQAVVMGIVEGATEFLPVSSTGHLIVVSQWMDMPQSESNKAFSVIIQLAAILAVAASYRNKFTLGHLDLWTKVILAFIPMGIVGLLFHEQIKALFTVPIVAVMFIVGGVIFLVVEYFYKEGSHSVSTVEDINYRQALWIGVAQVFALVPGTSRAGSTIIGALLVGLDRKTSAEFSFLLALPVMMAASGFDLVTHYQDFDTQNLIALGVGFFVSFIVAYVTMKLFLRFLAHFTFVAFGVYRIFFGLLLLGLSA